jgi:hypothetical protein
MNAVHTFSYFFKIYLYDLPIITLNKNKQTSWPLVLKQTTPTERSPLAGKVSANFCWQRGVTWSAQRVPTAINFNFLDWNHYFSFN